MTTEITTSKTFQDKMFERIRDQMGDLLTEEDLKKMVDAAMQKAFFDPIIERNSYGSVTNPNGPSAFVKMIEKLMTEQVGKEIRVWLDAHPEEVTKALTESLEKGMFKMALNYFESKTYAPFQELVIKLQQKGVL
jgi:ATP-dependent 26S proteasome regulatory subunit